jgi:site-specific DNA recombinase
MLNAYKAEEYVSEYLLNLDINELLKVHSQSKKSPMQRNDVKSSISNLNKTFDDNEKIIKGLIRRIGSLDDDDKLIKDYEAEIEALKVENNDITHNLAELQDSLQTVEDQEEFRADLKIKLNHFKQFFKSVDIESKRILIKDLVDNIVWYGETESIEINLIGSNKKLPNGKVRRRV